MNYKPYLMTQSIKPMNLNEPFKPRRSIKSRYAIPPSPYPIGMIKNITIVKDEEPFEQFEEWDDE